MKTNAAPHFVDARSLPPMINGPALDRPAIDLICGASREALSRGVRAFFTEPARAQVLQDAFRQRTGASSGQIRDAFAVKNDGDVTLRVTLDIPRSATCSTVSIIVAGAALEELARRVRAAS